jgi:hypothetical protein
MESHLELEYEKFGERGRDDEGVMKGEDLGRTNDHELLINK